jgi:hypothetical protein
MVRFILAHSERKFVCFIKEVDDEWTKVASFPNVILKTDCYGLLNRRSNLEDCKNSDVVIDDASLLNANERNRLFNFFNVRRKFGIRFWFLTHNFSKNLLEPLRLSSFQVVFLMKGASLDYPCLNVLLTGLPNMSKLIYPAYERIADLSSRQILVFDRDSQEFKLTTNDDTKLLTQLQNRAMNSGISKDEYLKKDDEPSGGGTNNNNLLSKKSLVKNLMQKGKTTAEIHREVEISDGYLRVILHDLRAEGLDVPRLKKGRPRTIKTISCGVCSPTEVIANVQR